MGRLRFVMGLISVLFAARAIAVDIPSGLVQDAEGLPKHTFELLISPAYLIQPSGAYLTSALRYQANEDFGTGFSFGAGELGFHFGAQGTWYILPDLKNQPAFAVLGGFYFTRLAQTSHFLLTATPTVSKTAKFNWGTIKPYAGWQMGPSFGLGNVRNEFSMRATAGAEFDVKSFNGLKLWTEAGVAVLNDVSQIVVGISYPFKTL